MLKLPNVSCAYRCTVEDAPDAATLSGRPAGPFHRSIVTLAILLPDTAEAGNPSSESRNGRMPWRVSARVQSKSQS